MSNAIAMQIIGAVLLLLGTAKIVSPVQFNERIFGQIPEAEVPRLASMRMVLGGNVMAVALINLICSVMVASEDASQAILVATAVGLLVFWGTIIGAKVRGFMDHIPLPPMILLPVLASVGLAGAFT